MRSPTRSSSWRRAALAAAMLGATALGAERTGDFSPYPNPDSGNVTDIAGVLTPEQHDDLERSLSDVESRTGTEIVVMIIRTLHEYPGAATGSIEDFANGLFKKYRIGDRPAGDGVLLVVSISDRKARIKLGPAYGPERNADAAAIMDGVMVPRFREGDYAGGISAGVDAMASEFAGVTLGFPWRAVWVVVGSIAAALIALSLVMSGKRGWGWVAVGLVLVFVVGALWMAIVILKALPRGVRHRHGGFFGGSDWGFSGGGGFGGGFSGGGGATGSW